MTKKNEAATLTAVWATPECDPAAVQAMADALPCSPILARLLWNRGIQTPETAQSFLALQMTDLVPPDAFSQMPRAVSAIHEALGRQEKIAIFGDYDVDGISSTAMLVNFFKLIKGQVKPFLPHRVNDGYGLSRENIDRMHQWGAKLIITCDNGISAADEVAYGKSLGMDFVITDHHEAPENPPRDVPILNPKLPGEPYPFKMLAGAGVAFKLVWALAQRLSGQTKVTEAFRAFLLQSLGFAALGTIADVVPLTGENRIIACHGLKTLQNAPSPGLAQLKKAVLNEGDVLTPRRVAFGIAPRLNAAGRLGEAERALTLLLTDDPQEATALVQELSSENERRRRIEQKIFEEACRLADDAIADSRCCLVLASQEWHIGVVGIAASRLTEKYEVPAILIALEGAEGRGSGRTAGGVQLLDLLHECGDLLESYGGHAEACGVRIRTDRVPDFTQRFKEAVQARYPVLRTRVPVDMVLPPHQVTGELLNEIQKLAPFGEGNPRPVFVAENASVTGKPQLMGKQRSHVSFLCQSQPYTFRTVFFGGADKLSSLTTPVTFAYEPFINTYMGFNQVELRVVRLFD